MLNARFPLPPLSEWASVADYGSKPIGGKEDVPDCGPALRRTIDSGKSVVYFPKGAWAIKTTVVIRGKVKLITVLDKRVLAVFLASILLACRGEINSRLKLLDRVQ